MPKRGIFGSYEEEFKKATSSVISEVKEKLPLDEYLRGQSVINNSVNNINNYDSYNSSFDSGYNNGNSMGNFEVKQKTLVRKMNTPYGYSNEAPQVDSTNNSNYSQQYMGGSSFDSVSSNDMWGNRTGFTQTLVLIMTAILVVLVVTVSLVVMNYIGI